MSERGSEQVFSNPTRRGGKVKLAFIWGSPFHTPLCPLQTQTCLVAAAAMISSFVRTLDARLEAAQQECNDDLVQRTAWLQETLARTKQQILYRT